MKIYRCQDFAKLQLEEYYEIKKSINLVSREEIMTIINACDHDEETLKDWINILGVNCQSVKILNVGIIFTVDNTDLLISELSSGERMILYIIACKKLNKKLVIHSLFERLGRRLRDVLDDVAYDYENLIVVLYNSGVTEKLRKCLMEVHK